jgi:hypothetical protein
MRRVFVFFFIFLQLTFADLKHHITCHDGCCHLAWPRVVVMFVASGVRRGDILSHLLEEESRRELTLTW